MEVGQCRRGRGEEEVCSREGENEGTGEKSLQMHTSPTVQPSGSPSLPAPSPISTPWAAGRLTSAGGLWGVGAGPVEALQAGADRGRRVGGVAAGWAGQAGGVPSHGLVGARRAGCGAEQGEDVRFTPLAASGAPVPVTEAPSQPSTPQGSLCFPAETYLPPGSSLFPSLRQITSIWSLGVGTVFPSMEK